MQDGLENSCSFLCDMTFFLLGAVRSGLRLYQLTKLCQHITIPECGGRKAGRGAWTRGGYQGMRLPRPDYPGTTFMPGCGPPTG